MQREGSGSLSYLPAEGGEGVQALLVLGGVALLRVIPAAALGEQRQVRASRDTQHKDRALSPPFGRNDPQRMEQHSPELTHGLTASVPFRKEKSLNKVLSPKNCGMVWVGKDLGLLHRGVLM